MMPTIYVRTNTTVNQVARLLPLGIAMDSISIYPHKKPATWKSILHVFPCHEQSLDNATPPGDRKIPICMDAQF